MAVKRINSSREDEQLSKDEAASEVRLTWRVANNRTEESKGWCWSCKRDSLSQDVDLKSAHETAPASRKSTEY